MNAHNDNTLPPRTGMRRVIPAWEYRNLRACAILRMVVGLALCTAGFVALNLHAYGSAALALVPGVSAFVFGNWEMSVARSAATRT